MNKEKEVRVLIDCKDLAVGYDTYVVAKGINFKVFEGDYLCIEGHNGVGKSTLMKTLLRLISPVDGEIVCDKSVKLGYLPQIKLNLQCFPITSEEVIKSGFVSRKPAISKLEQKEIVQKLAERFSLKYLLKRAYDDLSGGQQQKVLLCRALCSDSNILLLDEPTAGLDSDATAEMYNLMFSLNEEGKTIIMVTHDTETASLYAKHTLELGRDKVLWKEGKRFG